ncbi:MAG: Ig-like domain-containing protein, partial [Fusobacteriaceae bacterium]
MILVNQVLLTPKVTAGNVGQIVYFGYNITPYDATNKNVTVTSSNPEVIEVFQNSFRFKKPGAVVMTIASNDGGFTENFSVKCGSEEDYLATAKDLEMRLQKYYDVLKLDLNLSKDEALNDISETKLGIITEVERITVEMLESINRVSENNIQYLDDKVFEKIAELNKITTEHMIEIEKASENELELIDRKLDEILQYVDRVFESVKTFMNDKSEEFD